MRLVVESGADTGRSIVLGSVPVVVGRDPDCHLVLHDDWISRRHASVQLTDGEHVLVRDLGSRNGTSFDGRRILDSEVVSAGQRIAVGHTLIRFVSDGPRSDSALVRMVTRANRRTAVAVGLAAAAIVVVVVVVVLALADRDGQTSVEAIIDQIAPATVVVFTEIDGERLGTGTGWVLDADEGLIVTNHHVVNGGTSVAVGVSAGRRSAEIVGTAPCEDLAVLRVQDTSDLESMRLGAQDELRLGQSVIALGYPFNASLRDELTATTGVVSVTRTEFRLPALDVPRYPNVVQTDAAINPGNSGGPLVNLGGELVGVSSAGITMLDAQTTIQGQGFAIGVDRVREVVADLRDGRSRGWLGLGLEHVPAGTDLSSFGLPAVPGLLVQTAVPRTSGAAAGFGEAPVLIVGVNGHEMDGSLSAYCEAMEASDRPAILTVLTPGDRQAFDIEVPLA